MELIFVPRPPAFFAIRAQLGRVVQCVCTAVSWSSGGQNPIGIRNTGHCRPRCGQSEAWWRRSGQVLFSAAVGICSAGMSARAVPECTLTPVLEATEISVSFGGVHALAGLDLEIGEGQLVGLIGPNGAGKTTFIDAITGFVRSQGMVKLDGEDLTGLPPHVRAQRGLLRTWQSIELFDDLPVRGNLLVAPAPPPVWRTLKQAVTAPSTSSSGIKPPIELP